MSPCLACSQGRCEDCWTLGLYCNCCNQPEEETDDD